MKSFKDYTAEKVPGGWGLFNKGERIFKDTVYTSKEAVTRDIDYMKMVYDSTKCL